AAGPVGFRQVGGTEPGGPPGVACFAMSSHSSSARRRAVTQPGRSRAAAEAEAGDLPGGGGTGARRGRGSGRKRPGRTGGRAGGGVVVTPVDMNIARTKDPVLVIAAKVALSFSDQTIADARYWAERDGVSLSAWIDRAAQERALREIFDAHAAIVRKAGWDDE